MFDFRGHQTSDNIHGIHHYHIDKLFFNELNLNVLNPFSLALYSIIFIFHTILMINNHENVFIQNYHFKRMKKNSIFFVSIEKESRI